MLFNDYFTKKFILREWFEAREMFKKPVLRVYFGLHDTLSYTLYDRLKNAGYERLAKLIAGDPVNRMWHKLEWRPFKHQQVYDWKERKTVWRPEFLEKLKRLHLEDKVPMSISLPKWLEFSFVRSHVYVKAKMDHYSFEEPPFISIVLFGISLTLYWTAPGGKKSDRAPRDDAYWESLFDYLDWKATGWCDDMTLEQAAEKFSLRHGYWTDMDGNVSIFNLDHTFIANPILAAHMRLFNKQMYHRNKERHEKLKCTRCGYHMFLQDDDVVLTTNPVQYAYRCPKCHAIEYKSEKIDD